MTAATRRLEAIVDGGLTARERALLFVRAWLAGEEPDERLRKHCPDHQKAEFERTLQVVEESNQHVVEALAFWFEWLTQLDIQVGLAEAVVTLLPLTETGAKRPKRPPLLRPPGHGYVRDMPLAWGVKADVEESVPTTWAEAREQLLVECRQGVTVRWQEVTAMETALRELADELGEQVVHHNVRDGLEHCQRKILQLHSTLSELGECFALADPAGPHLERAREYVPVEKLRTAGPGSGLSRDLPGYHRVSARALNDGSGVGRAHNR